MTSKTLNSALNEPEQKSKLNEKVDETQDELSVTEAKCSFCSKSISNNLIKEHIRKHVETWGKVKTRSEEEDINIFNSSNTESNDISKNIVNNSDVEFIKCTFCPELVDKKNLRAHIHTHSLTWKGEKSTSKEKKERNRVDEIVCDYCEKSFNVMWKMTAHKRLHTGEKTF